MLRKPVISILEIMLVSQEPNGSSWKEKAFIKLKKRSELSNISYG